jgi:CheY-like chemotaxis protein
MCIFVVDDNKDAAMSLAELLRIVGHRPHTFFEGQSALAAAVTLRPAAAILDIGMPGMHGYDVAKRMREISPATLLIACTGWGAARDRERSTASGFDHHLVKPVGLEDLQRLFSAIPSETLNRAGC